jgi:pyruvate/2-oxoacid:ferredoxin oxidoreductase alpha subunit
MKVGVLRPITLFPFPKPHIKRLAASAQVFVVVEMSNGKMLEDVLLALNGERPVEFFSRVGGNVPSHDEVLGVVRETARRYGLAMKSDDERRANV